MAGMNIGAHLHLLDRLDSDLAQQEASIREARRRQVQNPELDAAERGAAARRDQLAQAMAEQRSLEAELADLETRISRDHTRLYSGVIVDPRELASLERELAHYRETAGQVEERCLEAMERVESLGVESADAARRANELRARWDADREALTREIESMVDALAGMREEREKLAAAFDPRTLERYQRLRSSLGHAVSAVDGGVCSSCHVTIPPKDVQHARESLVPCPNCGRFLSVP
ncbi:MAG TPA: C4-type zinc ribbon domain-containing protein [Chloroflexota bacterium]|nr:C4-type zinc ribbon domain-containing protein [Chloroflexota bacterium]